MASNIFGKIKGYAPAAATTEEEMYACPAGTTVKSGTLNICNRHTADQTYRVALTDTAGAADTGDWLIHDAPIGVNPQQISVSMSPGQTLRVYAENTAISFILSGLREVS